MAEIAITRELMPTKGRYVAHIDGVEGEAELTFSRSSATLVSAYHAFATDCVNRTGAAKTLVERLIANVRTEGFKLIPPCHYTKAQYHHHLEWADAMQD